MSESTAFKDYFNGDMVRRLAGLIQEVYGGFDVGGFVGDACRGLEDLELKGRSRHIAVCLRVYLPDDYVEAVGVLVESLGPPLGLNVESLNGGFFYWPYGDFVALYGLDFPRESMRANYEITRRFTAEFSIRPFVEQHWEYVLGLLLTWVKDPDAHVRRLVSEGTRPRLPWGGTLRGFVEDPSLCVPLLDALRDDVSLYVRRSVANHVNDIGRDHPAFALDLCVRWSVGASEEVWWVIRHALRNHVKRGDVGALALLGYGRAKVEVCLEVAPVSVAMGERVQLEVCVRSRSTKAQRIMLDYRMHFVRKQGKVGVKVFKWRDVELGAGETLCFRKSHSFRAVTTRVYYAGEHVVDVQVNGEVVAEGSFVLEG